MSAADAPDAASVAAAAGLHYTDASGPGIRRQARGRGFTYILADGSRVTDPSVRTRIEKLAIPPAWTDVWISIDPRAHLLATGRDARGRLQYRYHPKWRVVHDSDKFDHLAQFADVLPAVRGTVDDDLHRRGLDERRVVALVVRLLDETLIRVGNPQYATANGSHGLTTMPDADVTIKGAHLSFDFVGKSGVSQRVAVDDPRLARLARRCHELPGQQLFVYRDADRVVPVTSGSVNDYLREAAGRDVSAKDFRTWGGTTSAAAALALTDPTGSETAIERVVLAAYDVAAAVLGNTRAVCRACYVHPRVVESFRSGELGVIWKATRDGAKLSRIERTVVKALSG